MDVQTAWNILGYRRMTSWINNFNHTNYSQNRVHRIIKKLSIHSVIRKKKKKYNSSTPETTSENKLNRDFYATAPNEKWTTDVTEFKVPGEKKKLYLSAIIDLYGRYPVSYVISSRNDSKLVFKTFDKAISSNTMQNLFFIVIEAFNIQKQSISKETKSSGNGTINVQSWSLY